MERVCLDVNDGVAVITLNRPEKLNALDVPMIEGLIEVGQSLLTRTDVRAAVLHGAGRAFSAGLDFMSMMSLNDSVERLLARTEDSPANVAQRTAWIWRELPFPVIAALKGVVFGGGLQVALGADMRFATPDAQLSIMETKWGLCPDMGLSKTLPPLVGIDVAKWLTYSGRVFSGEDAQRWGLVTVLCEDPLEEALKEAREIAMRSPHAVQACKRLLNEAPDHSISEAFILEEKLQLELIGSPNQLEAMRAAFAKQTPHFQDPGES